MERSLKDLDDLAQAGAVVLIPWQQILPDKRQPRKYFNKTRMDALTGAIQESTQELPAVVRTLVADPNFRYKLVDGERRYRAAKALDQSVPCLIKEFKNEDEVLEFQVQANFNRDGHTPMEICNILQRLLATRRFQAIPKHKRMEALGSFFGHGTQWAWEHYGLRRLHPTLQRRIEPTAPKKEHIPKALGVKLAGFPHPEQLEMLKSITKRKLNFKGASRLVDRHSLDKGLDKHRRGRSPSDDFGITLRLAKRVQEETELVLQMDDERFKKMFATRDVVQRKRFMEELDMAVQSVDRIRQRARAVMRTVPAPTMVQ